jgi:hypothetical protein
MGCHWFRGMGWIAASLLLMTGTPAETRAALVITAIESGSHVIVSTSGGSLDLTGLSIESANTNAEPSWQPDRAILIIGEKDAALRVDVYDGMGGGPTSFPTDSGGSSYGAGGSIFEDCCSGDQVGVIDGRFLVVPAGFTGGPIGPSSSTWFDDTFASLDMTPGSYTWSWSADSVTLNVAPVPIPAVAWLFPAGLVAGLGWMRRQRKS